MSFRQPPELLVGSPFIFEEGTVNFDYPVHVFLADPFEEQPAVPLLYITEFDGKILIAIPYSAWNRQVTKRALPASSVTKVTAVEVLSARMSNRSEPLEEPRMKLWVGFLKRSFEKMVHTDLAEFDCDHFFAEHEEDPLMPFAQSLIDAAQEHFAFFSAEEHPEPDQDEVELMKDGDGVQADGAGSGSVKLLSLRVTHLESTLEEVNAGMRQLLDQTRGSPVAIDAPTRSNPGGRAPAIRMGASAKASAQGHNPSRDAGRDKAHVQFPLLDAGVVQAALQAGVPEANLMEMQRLLASNPKAAKLKDINPALRPVQDPLSEGEDEGDPPEAQPGGSGSGDTGDPMQNAVHRLTSIVELLAGDKRKRTATSKLEQALDGVAGSLGESSTSLGSGKKNAAARRCLRNMFQDQPTEISNVIERLMFEDLNSMTLGPGQQPLGLNARAWVEYRSMISNYKTSAHASWGIAGVLDSLIAGDVSKARARCCLLLLQLDQASIDKGNWSFSSDLSMEGLPPFSALANHQGPSLADGEQPFSRLLDSRWAEITLGFLREQDDYVLRRRNLGKQFPLKGKEGDLEDAEIRKKAKAKAKNKPSQSSQQDA